MAESAQDRLARLEARAAAAEGKIEALYGALRVSATMGRIVAEAEQLAFRRLLRLERAFVVLAGMHPGTGGSSIHVQQVVLALLNEIRHDLADYGQTKGGR